MLRAVVLLLNLVVALTWAATASSSVAATVFQSAPLCESAGTACDEDELGFDEDDPVDDEGSFDDEDFSDFDDDGSADFEDGDDDGRRGR